MESLVKALRKLRLRLLLIKWLDYAVRALFWATLAAFLWLLATRLFPQLGEPGNVVAVFVVVAVTAATVLALRRRPGLLAAALEADRRLDLDERLTSSLELAEVEGPMVAALHRDAEIHLSKLDIHRDFPIRPPRALRWLPLALSVFFAAYLFLPVFDLLGHQEKVEAAMKKKEEARIAAEAIREAVRPLKRKSESGDLKGLEGTLQAVERIAESLEAQEITEKQALARLSDLDEQLQDQRESLTTKAPTPNLATAAEPFQELQPVAEAIEQGQFANAAQKLRDMAQEMKEKMEKGELTPEDAEKVAKQLKQLSQSMGQSDPRLQNALDKLAAGLANQSQNQQGQNQQGQGENQANQSQQQPGGQGQQGQQQATQQQLAEALESMQMSMDDMASVLDQLQSLNQMSASLKDCRAQIGPGGLYAFPSALGGGDGVGLGMGGPGRGRGNQIGELPDVEGTFDPSLLQGELSKGKILASIMQRAAPEEGAESTIEYVSQGLIEIQQETEEALTKEEIPPGAREFVRQYFGSLTPETVAGETPAETSPNQ